MQRLLPIGISFTVKVSAASHMSPESIKLYPWAPNLSIQTVSWTFTLGLRKSNTICKNKIEITSKIQTYASSCVPISVNSIIW